MAVVRPEADSCCAVQGGREGQEGQEGGAVERAVVCGEADPSPGVGRLQGGGRPSLGQGDLRGRLSEGVAALQQALLLAHLHPLLRSSYPMLSPVLINVDVDAAIREHSVGGFGEGPLEGRDERKGLTLLLGGKRHSLHNRRGQQRGTLVHESLRKKD